MKRLRNQTPADFLPAFSFAPFSAGPEIVDPALARLTGHKLLKMPVDTESVCSRKSAELSASASCKTTSITLQTATAKWRRRAYDRAIELSV
jgi:hypothetical protein